MTGPTAPTQPPAQPEGIERRPWSTRSKAALAAGAVAVVAVVVLAVFFPTISSWFGGGGGEGPDLPEAPLFVNVQPGAGSNTISWAPVEGATGYRVYWSTAPGVSKEASSGVSTADTTYVHVSLVIGQTYYYAVTAVSPDGEGEQSTTVTGAPRHPIVSGIAIPPELDYTYTNGLPCGGLNCIYLRELEDPEWNPLATDDDSDPSFIFDVDMGKHYELLAEYRGGQIIAAITPKVTGDMRIDISFDSEVAADLVYTTEFKGGEYDKTRLSRDLDLLIVDANEAVARLNRFRACSGAGNCYADRLTDAVRSLALNKLNNNTYPIPTDFTPTMIRAFGGGLEGIRSLTEILNDPYPPMLPYVVFSRYNEKDEVDFGISDIKAQRWDYIGSWGYQPHMATGGDTIVCVMTVRYDEVNARAYWGVKVKTLGANEEWRVLTPDDMDCRSPCISPDQTRIVFTGRDVSDCIGSCNPLPPMNLFVIDIDGSDLKQITYDDLWYVCDEDRDDLGCVGPSWSPDGSRIVFTTNGFNYDGTDLVYMNSLELINPVGSGRRMVWDGNAYTWGCPGQPRYSPDGERIIFTATEDYSTSEILMIPSDFDSESNALYWRMTNNTFNEYFPSFSHTGRYILFSSDEGGEKGYINGEQVDMLPFYLANRWTSEVVTEFGNFAKAGKYYWPTLIGVCYYFTAKEGVQYDSNGNVVIQSGQADQRTTDDHSDGGVYYGTQNANSYYREIIPAANEMGITFGCTDW